MDRPTLALRARNHWATWLPQKTTHLKAAGLFNEASQAAAKAAQQEIVERMAAGANEHEAGEAALPLHILLDPEPSPDDDWEAVELAEMENAYQAMMRPFVEN